MFRELRWGEGGEHLGEEEVSSPGRKISGGAGRGGLKRRLKAGC